MKKLLATILSVIICVSLFTVPTFAASGSDIENYSAKSYENSERACKKDEFMFAQLRVIQKSRIRQGQMPLSSNVELDFNDANTLASYAIEEAKILKEYGILTGDSANNMNMKSLLTRAEAAQIFAKFNEKFLGMPEVNAEKAYSDVSTNHWAAQYISYTRKIGLFDKFGNNMFYPEYNISIAQVFETLDSEVGYSGIEQIDVASAMNDTFKIATNLANSGSNNIAVTMSGSLNTLLKGEIKTIQLSLLPESDRDIKVTSHNSNILKIISVDQDNDTVTVQGVSNGVAEMELYVEGTLNPFKTLIKMFVSKASSGLPVTDITITESLFLKKGETSVLEVIISPSDASDKSIIWFSEADRIASVDSNGIVTGNSKGAINIVAETGSGLRAYCTVTVS